MFIPFLANFCACCGPFINLHVDIQFSQHCLFRRMYLLCGIGILVEDYLTLYMRACMWAFYSSFFYVCLIVLNFFDNSSFGMCFTIWRHDGSNFTFSLQIVWDIWCSLTLHIKFRSVIQILIGIALHL